MSVESAEMTKHALNAFLATSVTFINEIAALCEQVGADAEEVERGLKSEVRIGPRAYLSPGGAFAGGTLARDVVCLSRLGRAHGVPTDAAVGDQVEQRCAPRLGPAAADPGARRGHGQAGRRLGADLQAGHRHAAAVQFGRAVSGARAEGATVQAHDPGVRELPAQAGVGIRLLADPLDALAGASALVVATQWPEYRTVPADDVVAKNEAGRRPRCGPVPGRDARERPASAVLQRGQGHGMTRPLEGRSALITGASQGLGLAIARAYVAAGASVVLCARDAELLEHASREVAALAGPAQRVVARAADVSRKDEADALARAALEAFPDLHVLVNNAGVYGPMGPIEDVDWDAWVRAIEINLLGSVLMCRALLPHFKARRTARSCSCRAAAPPARCPASAPMPRRRRRSCVSPRRWPRRCAATASTSTPSRRARSTPGCSTRCSPAAPRRRRGVLRACGQAARRGRRAPRDGRRAGGVPGLGGERRHHGQTAERGLGPVGALPEHRDDSDRTDVYTLRRIVPDDRGIHVGQEMSVGVAIVGCGLIGRKRAAALGAARLVACADVRRERAAGSGPARPRARRRPTTGGRRSGARTWTSSSSRRPTTRWPRSRGRPSRPASTCWSRSPAPASVAEIDPVIAAARADGTAACGSASTTATIRRC